MQSPALWGLLWDNELQLSQTQYNCAAQLNETSMSKEMAGCTLQGQDPMAPECIGCPQWNPPLLQMQYLQPLPGSCISMDPSSFIDVYGYIATPRIWRQKSSLTWRLGPTYLFEEAISVETIEVIIKLGPQYCSNFQAVQLQGMW